MFILVLLVYSESTLPTQTSLALVKNGLAPIHRLIRFPLACSHVKTTVFDFESYVLLLYTRQLTERIILAILNLIGSYLHLDLVDQRGLDIIHFKRWKMLLHLGP